MPMMWCFYKPVRKNICAGYLLVYAEPSER